MKPTSESFTKRVTKLRAKPTPKRTYPPIETTVEGWLYKTRGHGYRRRIKRATEALRTFTLNRELVEHTLFTKLTRKPSRSQVDALHWFLDAATIDKRNE